MKGGYNVDAESLGMTCGGGLWRWPVGCEKIDERLSNGKTLHAKDAKLRRFNRRVCRRSQPQRQHASRIARGDDAIVP